MKKSYLFIVGLLVFNIGYGQSEPTAQEIADKAAISSYYKDDDGRALVNMTITDKQDRTRSREMVILRRDVAVELGDQQFYVYFTAPTDISETSFLVWKHTSSDDDRWLYLPALDLVRRIAASDERTSFVGSHFFYEDVSGRSPQEDDHELIKTTDHYYVLKSTPKNAGDVEFVSYTSYIHKTSFIPVKTEYTNKQGEVYRYYEATKVETIDGFPTVTQAKMTDKNRGGHTVLDYSQIEYGIGMDEGIFSERYLRNPPMDYLNTK